MGRLDIFGGDFNPTRRGRYRNGPTLTFFMVEQQIQDKLNREPALANTAIGVKIDAKSVTLTGSVDTERQRDLALRIAQSYAGHRRIVDKIKIQRQA